MLPKATAWRIERRLATTRKKSFELAEGIVRSFAILIAAATMYSGAHNPVADGKILLAQAVTTPPTVTPSPNPSTPVTSTVTNCMMSCNSQAANCHAGCVIPSPTASACASSVLGVCPAATTSGPGKFLHQGTHQHLAPHRGLALCGVLTEKNASPAHGALIKVTEKHEHFTVSEA